LLSVKAISTRRCSYNENPEEIDINLVMKFACYAFKVFLAFFFLLLVKQVAAQTSKLHFTTISSKDGLSSNTINAILKDQYGFVWFGTEDGLTKFDGTDYTIYRHNPKDTTSLWSNEITCLYEDKAKRLWVGTSGGSLHLYDRNRDAFIHYLSNSEKNGFTSAIIKGICEDYQGRLWVATLGGLNALNVGSGKVLKFGEMRGIPKEIGQQPVLSVFEDSHRQMWIGAKAGLFKYNRKNQKFIAYQHDAKNPHSLAGENIKTIAEDRFKNLWVGTNGGLSKLMADSINFQNITETANGETKLTSNVIYAIAAAGKDELWVGTEEGLNVLNVQSGKVAYYRPDGRNSFSLSGKSVRSILIDKQGINWLGTYVAGVNKYDSNLTFFSHKKSNQYDPFGLSSTFVTSFAQADKGDIFVGTDGGGLNLYHRNTGLFSHYKLSSIKRPNVAGLSILALARSKDGTLWAGTFQDGLFKIDPASGKFSQYLEGKDASSIVQNDVFCLKEDQSGKLWIGTNGGGVSVYDPKSKKFKSYNHNRINEFDLPLNGYIRDFEEDRSGRMWIASHGTGIAVFDPTHQKFTVLSRLARNLPSDIINVLFEDSKGNMWAGTGDGLVRINAQTFKAELFGESAGLSDINVHSVLEDRFGRIWFSTNKGVSWINPQSKKVTNYSTFNGLQSGSFEQGAGFVDEYGVLYFGGIDGFNYLQPDAVFINNNMPPILFTSLKVDGKPVNNKETDILSKDITVADELQLEYKQNFSISYVGLNFTSPKQNNYYYRLKGFDKNWINAGTKTTAYYTNLSPGEYTFEVKASNNDGLWNSKEKSIRILIRPPFWMTIYAYVFYIVAAGCILLLLRHRGIKRLRQEFKQEEAKRETERLHELDRLKIKFITNLSHDFRTPIALIAAPVDKLLSESTDEQVRTQLHVVKKNTRRLLNLVNQLFDFRKIEERELQLNAVNGEVIAFIKEVSESFQDLSEKKHISLTFKSSLNELYTDFDPDKLERTLFNLLSNAFKFTLEGGKVRVMVYVETAPDDPTIHHLVIEVSDTGIGIEPAQQEHIFTRFYQNQQSTAGFNTGSGIGLSIVKEFVQLHGGTIKLDSKPGIGSTFRVEIPVSPQVIVQQPQSLLVQEKVVQALVEEVSPQVIEPVSKDMEGLPLVLIVEDNEDFRFYLKDNLKLKYKIIEAADGKEGWQKALASHPELIISDIMMPHMDGIELSRKLKADKRTSHIPLILLTASSGEEEQIKGLTSGANDYLNKPFNFKVLQIKINNLLFFNRTLEKTYTNRVKLIAEEVKVESANEKFLKTVVDYIEENLNNTQLSVEDLSRQMGISRGSLYNKLLEITGQSPVEFIRSIKLEKAVVLLEKSDMNIAQIAYASGFATPNYFTRAFKAKYEMLPSQYIALKMQQVQTITNET
jgi:signal transduction histidine kinase/ligand-binding sensor domain-containing protein/DNA-binding response OmpR family regulator